MATHKDYGKGTTKAPPGHHMMPNGKPMADKDMPKHGGKGGAAAKGK